MSLFCKYLTAGVHHRFLCRVMSTTALVKYEIFDGDIALIGINRPEKRNCVNEETASDLIDSFRMFEADDKVKSAVFYGVGGNFCAGWDLSRVSDVDVASSKLAELTSTDVRPMGPSVMRFSKPVIGAIEGFAVAGGLELSLICDVRVAEDTTVFGVFCRRFGVPLIDGGTVRLPKVVGLGRAMDLILTGREVSGKEAHAIGLANRVVPTGAALGQAVKLAKSINKFPQECLKADRRSAYYSAFDAVSFQDAFDYELRNGLPIIALEAKAGASKFAHDKIGRHGSFNIDQIPSPTGRKSKM